MSEEADDGMSEQYDNGNLTFIGHDTECIPNWLSTKYGENAVRADFSFNNLRSIKGLKGFKKLKELVLDNNNLSDDLIFPTLERLETLTMNKNNINNLEVFMEKITESLPNLTYLSLLGNKACPNQLTSLENNEDDYQRYRYYVLYKIPKLHFLDSTPVTSTERKEAKRIGAFTKIVSADSTEMIENSADEDLRKSEGYTPLPPSRTFDDDVEQQAKSTFGKCRYVYYGKHSEGNRFIVNNDL